MTEEWNEKRARTAHERREHYAVLIELPDGTYRMIEACGDYFGIEFIDNRQRAFLSYQFQELEPGRLFLTMALYREFEGSTTRVTNSRTYRSRPDGSLIIHEEDADSPTATRLESKEPIDVSSNWEPYPAFGDYQSLTRIERE